MEKEMIKDQDTNLEEVESYEELEPQGKGLTEESYFDGGLLQLIGWRLLALLITVITFGIAAPWAECMLYSWQFKHTVYNGKRLKFEGTGGSLFLNALKWLFFTIITLGIYLIVIPVRKTRWVISNIHFEDEPFVKEESYFDGKTIQLIGVNILCSILTTISLGILYPFTVCYKLKWINKHTVINNKKLSFTGKALSLWGKYIGWFLLTIVTFGIYGLWIPIKMLKWQTKNTHIKRAGEVETPRDNTTLIIVSVIILAILVIGPSTSLIVSNVRKNKVVKTIEKTVETIPSTITSTIQSTTNSNTKNKKVIKRTKSSFNLKEEEAYRKKQQKKNQIVTNPVVPGNETTENAIGNITN